MSLPYNFSFIWEDRVAGSGHPGTGEELEASLAALREEGVLAVLSLTEDPLEMGPIRRFEMDYMHLPVDDFTAPTQEQIDEAVQFIDEQLEHGRGALVHCRAGIGRTGTILACFLVSRGLSAPNAIRRVRRLRPGSVEVYAQEMAVHRYAQRRAEP